MTARRHAKQFFIGVAVVIAGIATAATFNQFSPATGVLKGNASTFVTTAAVSSDIRAMWTGTCDATTFMRGDGACAAAATGSVTSVGLTMPTGFSVAGSPVTTNGTLAVTTALNGPLRGNGSAFITGNTSLTTEVSGILPGANGGTNNGFMNFTGPSGTLKTFTLPNVSVSILTTNAAVTFAQGGTGLGTAADDTTLVSSGSAWAATALPNCGSSTQALAYTTSTNSFSCQTVTGTTTFANPAGSVGLSAVNGVATTAMRSDAAPALSQSITPTWSGTHVFTGGAAFNTMSPFFNVMPIITPGGDSLRILEDGSNALISFYNSTNVTRHGYLNSNVAGSRIELVGEGTWAVDLLVGGAERLKIDTDGSWDLAGTTPGTSGQAIVSNGSAAAPTWQTVGLSSSGTFTITLTGFTTTVSGTATYQRVGTMVMLFIPQLSGTSNTTALTATGLPADIQSSTVQAFPTPSYSFTDSSITAQALVRGSVSGGTLTFSVGGSASGWTASGTKGINTSGITICYLTI